MIVEICGLPGAGKSFLIQQLNGSRIHDGKDGRKLLAFFIRIAKKAAVWMPSSLILKRKIKGALKDIPEQASFFPRKKSNYINKLAMLAFGYRWSGRNVIYVDEGIVHQVVSFAVNYNFPMEKVFGLLDVLRKYMIHTEVIYLNVDLDECLKSIRKRNRHVCDMDELTGEQLRCFLSSYRKYFEAINQKYQYRTIGRDQYNEIKGIFK